MEPDESGSSQNSSRRNSSSNYEGGNEEFTAATGSIDQLGDLCRWVEPYCDKPIQIGLPSTMQGNNLRAIGMLSSSKGWRASWPLKIVLGAHDIKASWDSIPARSGLDTIYDLYMGDEVIYEGKETSYVVSGLDEMTEYSFKVRAWTHGDEESAASNVSKAVTFRAVSSAPRNLRAVTVTPSLIKLVWNPPDRVYGVLNGYKVREAGNDIAYEPVSTYHIAGNLKQDTEYTFEVVAVTKRGQGEPAKITLKTLRHDTYAPSKPDLTTIGPHEILATWEAPDAPIKRVNGYELLVNGKRFFYGMEKRCMVNFLKPDTSYEFQVVAWTNEGSCKSETASKKTSSNDLSRSPRRRPWKTKVALLQWLKSHEDSTARSEKSMEQNAPNDSSRSFGEPEETLGQSLEHRKSSRSARISWNDKSHSSDSIGTVKSHSEKSFNTYHKPSTKGSRSNLGVKKKDKEI